MPEPTTTVDSLVRAVARAPAAGDWRGIVPGTRVDEHFDIVEELGRGGLGVVYRAVDRRLGREVAIKVMRRDRWAQVDAAQRAALFEREARATARLRHPNIVTLHDVGEHDGTPYLVLELLPGTSLAGRLRRPLPLPLAAAIMTQVAAAMVHAHAEGVLHRDLKPHNVRIDADDHAWVLDFGLAALLDIAPAAGRAGTPSYMAPEQRVGGDQDARTDVWAMGLLFFQMLTAYEPPPLEHAEALRTAPWRDDLDRLAPPIAALVDAAVRWETAERLPSAAAFADRLAALDCGGPVWRTAPARPWRWAAVAAAGATAATLLATRPHLTDVADPESPGTPPPAPSLHFALDVPASEPFATFQGPMLAVSPDGHTIVFQGRPPAGVPGSTQLYLRALDDDDAVPLERTVDAEGPFFSPDGTSLAYAKGGSLWRRPLAGGDAVELCAVQAGFRGGTWLGTDAIVFAPSWFSGLFVVPASGGTPRPLTQLGPDEKSHRFPHALPGGDAVLFVSSHARTESFDDATIEVVRPSTGERTALASGGAPRFVAPDTLLVPRDGSLTALQLDPRTLEVTGPPRVAVEGMVTAPTTGVGAYDVAGGTLVYVPGGPELFHTRIVRIDAAGDITTLPLPARSTTSVRRVAEDRLLLRVDAANAALWLHDVGRETDTRVTGAWDADHAVVLPGAQHLLFELTRGAQAQIVRRRSDGVGTDDVVWRGTNPANLELSRDGQVLLFDERDAITGSADVFWMPADGTAAPVSVTATPDATETQPALSPDGRWLAFTSSVSGRNEIYVQGFPDAPARTQVSAHGGRWARWSDDGRTLWFRAGAELLEVDFTAGDPPTVTRPRVRTVIEDIDDPARRTFDILANGDVLTVMHPEHWRPADRLRVVTNWVP